MQLLGQYELFYNLSFSHTYQSPQRITREIFCALKVDRSRGGLREKEMAIVKHNKREAKQIKKISIWHRFMSQAGTNNDFEIYKHDRLAVHFASVYVCMCLVKSLYIIKYIDICIIYNYI